MIFAIYLLICGVALPVIVGFHIYKKLMKGVKPSEKDDRSSQKNELQS